MELETEIEIELGILRMSKEFLRLLRNPKELTGILRSLKEFLRILRNSEES